MCWVCPVLAKASDCHGPRRSKLHSSPGRTGTLSENFQMKGFIFEWYSCQSENRTKYFRLHLYLLKSMLRKKAERVLQECLTNRDPRKTTDIWQTTNMWQGLLSAVCVLIMSNQISSPTYWGRIGRVCSIVELLQLCVQIFSPRNWGQIVTLVKYWIWL